MAKDKEGHGSESGADNHPMDMRGTLGPAKDKGGYLASPEHRGRNNMTHGKEEANEYNRELGLRIRNTGRGGRLPPTSR